MPWLDVKNAPRSHGCSYPAFGKVEGRRWQCSDCGRVWSCHAYTLDSWTTGWEWEEAENAER